jgi:hypothetical protein
VKVELRKDTGDLILYAANGDPILKLQRDGPFIQVNSGSHVLDSRAEVLSGEAVDEISKWLAGVSTDAA